MKVDRSFSTASTCGMPRVVREIVATLLAFACYQRSMTFRTYAPAGMTSRHLSRFDKPIVK